MKKWMKQGLSFLLVLLLAVGLVPVQTYGTSVDGWDGEDWVGETPVAAETSKGLTDLLLFTGSSKAKMESTALLGKENVSGSDRVIFNPEQREYTMEVSDTVLNANTNLRFALETEESGATVEVIGGANSPKSLTVANTSTYTAANWEKVITKPGKNEFRIVVTPPAVTSPVDAEPKEPAIYHFTVYCIPTLSALSVKAAGNEVHFTESFAATTANYSGNVASGAQEAEVTATPKYSDYTVSYNGVSSNKVDISETKNIEIEVGIGEGEDYRSSNYTVTLNPSDDYSMQIGTTPAKAGKTLYEIYKEGSKEISTRKYPDQDGVFRGLLEGATYQYVVTAPGYVAQSGTVSSANALMDGKLLISLKKAAENNPPLTKYTGDWINFRNNDENMGITDKKTATVSENANLKWAVKYGTGWSAAPTPPIVLNGDLYIASAKKVFRLNKETGEVLAQSEDMVANVGYALNPITYGEGLLFIPVGTGRIQALRADTLESVWVSEKIGGQTLCPITYKNGYVYEGTWNSELKTGTYYGLTATDEDPTQKTEEKKCSWKVDHTGGFYWAGAYATDSYVIFGSDDGNNEGTYVTTAVLYSVDPVSGEILDTIEGIKGDIRSTVSYDEKTDRIYFSTKGGWFYSVKVNEDGTFIQDSVKYMETGGMSTGTPLVYKGRAYLGVSGTSQFSSAGHSYKVIDVESMTEIYDVSIPGYVQSSAMLSTAYEEKTGKIYIYVTYNCTPGGIYVFEDSAGQTEAKGYHLYVPTGSYAQYCLCSPVCDADGTIYFKNDSCYLMAIENTAFEKPEEPDPQPVSVNSVSLNKASASMKAGETLQLTAQILPADAKEQGVIWSTSEKSIAMVDEKGLVTAVAKGTAKIQVTTKDGAKTAECSITVEEESKTPDEPDPQPVSVNSISLNRTELSIKPDRTVQLTAQILPENAKVKEVTWTTSDDAIATVTADGLVTSVAEGNVTITATTKDGGKTAVCEITVIDKAAKTIKLLEKNKIMKTGETYALQVKTTPVGNGDILSYSSSKEEVAAVNADGIVTGMSEGIAKITVKTEKGKKAVCTIKVDRTIPIVTGVSENNIKKNAVTLSWNKVESAEGYYVYLYTPATAKKAEKYKRIKTLKAVKSAEAATTCQIKGLKAATNYQYVVCAFDKRTDNSIAAGEYSEKRSVLTLPTTSAVKKAKKSADKFLLIWKKVKGVSGYTVYTSTEKNGSYTEIGTFEGEKTLTTTIAMPESGDHYFKVRTYIMNGKEKLYSDYSSAKKVRIR